MFGQQACNFCKNIALHHDQVQLPLPSVIVVAMYFHRCLTNQQSTNQAATLIKQPVSCGYPGLAITNLYFLYFTTPNRYFLPLSGFGTLSSLLNNAIVFRGIFWKRRFEESSLIPVFNGVKNPCFDVRLIKHRFNHLKTRVYPLKAVFNELMCKMASIFLCQHFFFSTSSKY